MISSVKEFYPKLGIDDELCDCTHISSIYAPKPNIVNLLRMVNILYIL